MTTIARPSAAREGGGVVTDTIERRLRELCEARLDAMERGLSIAKSLDLAREAARIGAEVEREECAALPVPLGPADSGAARAIEAVNAYRKAILARSAK